MDSTTSFWNQEQVSNQFHVFPKPLKSIITGEILAKRKRFMSFKLRFSPISNSNWPCKPHKRLQDSIHPWQIFWNLNCNKRKLFNGKGKIVGGCAVCKRTFITDLKIVCARF